jgi:glycosyltransferase involved in cell wall biosynthesis
MVCSQWAKNVAIDQCHKALKSSHKSLVHVVPLGVDAELFPPAPARQGDKTIFFNCGKWEIRKGHDIIIQAFKKVVEEYDNVELWMMCSNPFNSQEENNRWHQLYNHPKVKLIPRAETQAEVYNIMSQVDCGVFPSRGEGWNLELLEMMAAGKHVITTNYSAHTEFCNKDNAGLIPIEDVEPAFDGKWFFGQGNWAKITEKEIDNLANKMSSFHSRRPTRSDYLNTAGIETARKFSWQNTAREIIKCLKE